MPSQADRCEWVRIYVCMRLYKIAAVPVAHHIWCICDASHCTVFFSYEIRGSQRASASVRYSQCIRTMHCECVYTILSLTRGSISAPTFTQLLRKRIAYKMWVCVCVFAGRRETYWRRPWCSSERAEADNLHLQTIHYYMFHSSGFVPVTTWIVHQIFSLRRMQQSRSDASCQL